jgi:metal-responsive CopG/Arc/MetJ family transcriptional regulator
MDMSTQQILIRLPEDVAAKFEAVVPARQRNKFVTDLVATAIARHEDELAKIATAVTNEEKSNPKIAEETRDWETTIDDGLKEKHAKNAKPQTR